MRQFSSILSVLLVSSLVAPAETVEGNLRLVVVSGDGAVNNVRRKIIAPVAVEVRDERNRPVEGARVRFTLPALGAGGRFADGSRTSEVMSDARGRASIDSFVPNEQEGRFTLVVDAISKGRDATTSVSQMNSRYVVPAPSSGAEMRPARQRGTRALAIVLGVGAAAAAGGILAIKGGSKASTTAVTAPVGISIGGVGVGGPQ